MVIDFCLDDELLCTIKSFPEPSIGDIVKLSGFKYVITSKYWSLDSERMIVDIKEPRAQSDNHPYLVEITEILKTGEANVIKVFTLANSEHDARKRIERDLNTYLPKSTKCERINESKSKIISSTEYDKNKIILVEKLKSFRVIYNIITNNKTNFGSAFIVGIDENDVAKKLMNFYSNEYNSQFDESIEIISIDETDEISIVKDPLIKIDVY